MVRVSTKQRMTPPQVPPPRLLGLKVVGSNGDVPVWNVPWLRNHEVRENIIFPFSGDILVAGQAMRQVANTDDGSTIRSILVSTALILSNGKPAKMMATLSPHHLSDTLNSQ